MCKGNQSGGTQQVTSSNSPDPQLRADYQNVVDRAKGNADTPLTQYSGPMVAGFTPAQMSAFNTVNNAQGVANPYINTAAGFAAAGTTPVTPAAFSGQAVQQYMSPYTQNVVDTTRANIDESNAEQQQGVVGNAISKGAWGGDRAGIAQSELARQQKLAEDQTIAGLQNQGYAQGLGEFNTQQQVGVGAQEAQNWLAENASSQFGALGNEALNTTLSGANAQLAAGQQQQQQAQSELNVPYEQFLQRQAYPFQTTNYLAGITEGVGGLSGGTSTTTSPAPGVGAQTAGLGLGALGLIGGTGGFGSDGWLHSIGLASGGRTRTPLLPHDEEQFQSWYAEMARRARLDPDVDAPEHHYDMRGAWQSGALGAVDPDDNRLHFPSEYKDDDHPNRFIDRAGGTLDTKYGVQQGFAPGGHVSGDPWVEGVTVSGDPWIEGVPFIPDVKSAPHNKGKGPPDFPKAFDPGDPLAAVKDIGKLGLRPKNTPQVPYDSGGAEAGAAEEAANGQSAGAGWFGGDVSGSVGGFGSDAGDAGDIADIGSDLGDLGGFFKRGGRAGFAGGGDASFEPWQGGAGAPGLSPLITGFLPSPGRGIPVPLIGGAPNSPLDINPVSNYSPPAGPATPAAPTDPGGGGTGMTPIGLPPESGGNTGDHADGGGSSDQGGSSPSDQGPTGEAPGTPPGANTRGTVSKDTENAISKGLGYGALAVGLATNPLGTLGMMAAKGTLGSLFGAKDDDAIDPVTGAIDNNSNNQNSVDNNNNSTEATSNEGVGTSVGSGQTEGASGAMGGPGGSTGSGSVGSGTGATGPGGGENGSGHDAGPGGGTGGGGATDSGTGGGKGDGAGAGGGMGGGGGDEARGGTVRWRHRFDDGGSVDGLPSPTMAAGPMAQNSYEHYAKMPSEQLQELSQRLPQMSRYGQMVRHALAMKHIGGDNATATQAATPQAAQAPQGFAAAPQGFAVAPTPTGGAALAVGGFRSGGRAGFAHGGDAFDDDDFAPVPVRTNVRDEDDYAPVPQRYVPGMTLPRGFVPAQAPEQPSPATVRPSMRFSRDDDDDRPPARFVGATLPLPQRDTDADAQALDGPSPSQRAARSVAPSADPVDGLLPSERIANNAPPPATLFGNSRAEIAYRKFIAEQRASEVHDAERGFTNRVVRPTTDWVKSQYTPAMEGAFRGMSAEDVAEERAAAAARGEGSPSPTQPSGAAEEATEYPDDPRRAGPGMGARVEPPFGRPEMEQPGVAGFAPVPAGVRPGAPRPGFMPARSVDRPAIATSDTGTHGPDDRDKDATPTDAHRFDSIPPTSLAKKGATDATSRNIAQSPWLALAAAGFGMAASRNPQALGAAGEGALHGVKTIQEQQVADLKQQSIDNEKQYREDAIAARKQGYELEAKKLDQLAGQHRDTLAESRREHDLVNSRMIESNRLTNLTREDAINRGRWQYMGPSQDPDNPGSVMFDSTTHQTVIEPVTVGPKSGRTPDRQWAYDTYLKSHPGDTSGAEEFAQRRRQLSDAEINRSALIAANHDYDHESLPPKDRVGYVNERAAAYAERMRTGFGPQAAPAAAPAAPAIPAALSHIDYTKLTYSPSKGRWKDTDNNFYDAQGNRIDPSTGKRI